MQGRIIKGIGGFYDVLLSDGSISTCKARGRFRKEGLTPMVGDTVEIAPQAEGLAAIESILPRKNELLRPPVANIDQLIIVVAASAPKPDWLLVDKLLLQAHLAKIEPLLVLNKLDEQDAEIVKTFEEDYSIPFHTLALSARSGQELNSLKSCLADKISCFAGQSAVGKSSLLNALIPDLHLETGGLAKKTDRGRHTTRHAELWPFYGGAVLDTPGFSLFEMEDISQKLLNQCYPEFGDAPTHCRFAGCSHRSEPDCAVKELLKNGRLSQGRYIRYQQLVDEILLRRKHQYD